MPATLASDPGQGRCSMFCVYSRLSQLSGKVRSRFYKETVASRTTGTCWETDTKQGPAGVCDLMTQWALRAHLEIFPRTPSYDIASIEVDLLRTQLSVLHVQSRQMT